MAITYNVYRDGEKIVSGLTTPEFTDTELTPETTYEYQVSAENSYGESPLSSPVTATTDGVAPEQPEGLTVNGTTDTSVDLGWQ